MSGEKRVVLVVDDDAAHRYSIGRRLEQAGFDILEASHGEEAIRLAASVDAIILDVQLPDISGFEVCRRLREDLRLLDVPIIHISAAYVDPADLVQGLEIGADAYLTRPIDDGVVVANLHASLRLRDNLRRLTDELDVKRREEERARDLFVAVLGHDLRNPLDAISMSAHLLARAPQSADLVQKATKRISTAVLRMTHMLDDIQDYARSRLGSGLELHRTPARLKDLVTEAVEELRAAHPRVQIDVDSDDDVEHLWDAPRLTRVIMNLLRNAVQHGDGSQPIVVKVGASGSAQNLTVHNHGAPITEDVMSRLFQPMVRRLDVAPDSSNMGLGLFVCRELVHAHGGTISVTSGEDGTEFRVQLPTLPV